MMRKKPIYIILVLLILCSVTYFFTSQFGYSLNEKSVLLKSFPFQNGHVVYQKEFGNNKIVIWDTGDKKYAKVVKVAWGMLYQVRNISEMLPREPNDFISRTWSASLNSTGRYETIFAVEAKNPDIEKVIISNDNIDHEISNQLKEIKQKSSVYIELKVQDGFAVSYNELPMNDVGNFVFRGLDHKGQIITAGR
ncbi:hypothetical protein G8C92_24155 [Paenibacillus donghaensis]|uniref:hypothetical protein n=1 Tax=Paenibacillus donghaensis TaxID=414771 RepID=UPI00188325BA|nr:hypothetical protein [Paenibacillus donghaensis]MBE9917117.1 hypothetical protein [Paenibacillus donghaensis]